MISAVRNFLWFSVAIVLLADGMAFADKDKEMKDEKLSPQTETCIGCHKIYTPGIVQDWLTSRHSRTVP